MGKSFPVQIRYAVKSFVKDWNQGGLPGEKFEEKGRDLAEGWKQLKSLKKQDMMRSMRMPVLSRDITGHIHQNIRSMGVTWIGQKN